jgi:uncharacterized membrane protein
MSANQGRIAQPLAIPLSILHKNIATTHKLALSFISLIIITFVTTVGLRSNDGANQVSNTVVVSCRSATTGNIHIIVTSLFPSLGEIFGSWVLLRGSADSSSFSKV